MSEPVKVVVFLDGGTILDICSMGVAVEAMIIDYDISNSEPGTVSQVLREDGIAAQALVYVETLPRLTCPARNGVQALWHEPQAEPPAPDLHAELHGLISRGLAFSTALQAFVQHQAITDPHLATYWLAADRMRVVEDRVCEIDSAGAGGGTIVSATGDDGAYVLAWVWVDDETAGVDRELDGS